MVYMFDLLDVEKNPKAGISPVLTYNEYVLNHISLLKKSFVANKVGLYITDIYYVYKPVQYTRLASTCVTGNTLKICKMNMALHI